MNYRSFQILGLFGRDISLEFEDGVGATFLTGGNGTGKTITLEVIAAWRAGDYGRLYTYPWSGLRVELSDGEVLHLDRCEGLPTHAEAFRLRSPEVKFIRRDLSLADMNLQLRQCLAKTLRAYTNKSVSVDAVFLQRLVTASTCGDVGALVCAVQQQELLLHAAGLLDSEVSLSLPDASDDVAYAVFLESLLEKRACLEDLARRLSFVKEAVGRNFDLQKVLVVEDWSYRVETREGQVLGWEALSPGEKNLLVLLHSLVFDVAPGSLVLVDEPERSLSVRWQLDLSDVFQGITEVDLLVVTHSSHICGRLLLF